MSRSLVRDPLAITSDGTVLLNLAMFDVPKRIEKLVELAMAERGAVFIGIAVTRHEQQRLRVEFDDAALQAAYGVAGTRQKKRMKKK